MSFYVIKNVSSLIRSLCGIGRGGETLKLISRTSGARVNCSRERGHSLKEKGKITITGTRQEVQRAKVGGCSASKRCKVA